MTCSACGTALPAAARFCPACGAAAAAVPAAGEERKLATDRPRSCARGRTWSPSRSGRSAQPGATTSSSLAGRSGSTLSGSTGTRAQTQRLLEGLS
ncbi:MAG: zinc-ribbon domain-containing protein [Gemmatimonadota bacterium]